jgi:hypothetical protein
MCASNKSESPILLSFIISMIILKQLMIMAPRRKNRETEEDDARDTPKIVNIGGKGLGYYDKNTKLVQVSDVGLKLVGSAFCSPYGLKGNV